MTKRLLEMTLEELWELFPIELTEHRSEWAAQYAQMEARLLGILPSRAVVRISHIGSTAVAGIWAKPIVDVLVEIEEGAGKPDGLCVDVEGGVWVALHRGSAVRRYDAEGRLSEVVELPVNKVTACTFGGEGLDRLYITTSRENLPDDVEPASGSVYLAEVGVKGLEPLAFAG